MANRMNWFLCISVVGLSLLIGTPVQATVVPLNIDNNGNVITGDANIVDVNVQNLGGNTWQVSVGQGLNFEEFFANFSGTVTSLDSITTPASGWSLVPGGGHPGNFGAFSIKLDGPVSVGSPDLVFTFTAAGLFEPNSKGNTFAAKISSQQGGFAGGFVSNGGVSAVPLPGAVWLFLTALAGLGLYSRRRTAGVG